MMGNVLGVRRLRAVVRLLFMNLFFDLMIGKFITTNIIRDSRLTVLLIEILK
jgi:hypothetical protein